MYPFKCFYSSFSCDKSNLLFNSIFSASEPSERRAQVEVVKKPRHPLIKPAQVQDHLASSLYDGRSIK